MGLGVEKLLWRSTLIALPLTIAILYWLFWPVSGWADSLGYHAGRDFLNFWFGPHLALEGRVGEVYDLAAYHDAIKTEMAPGSPFMNFSYPPTMLFLLLPLGVFSYPVAYVLWGILAAILFVLAAMGRANVNWGPVLLLLISPAFLATATIGQCAPALAFLLIGGLRWRSSRPVLAGVLFGLLTVKPQLGLLLPLVLLMERRWVVIGSAAATALCLVLMSVLAFGVEPWQAYVDNVIPYQAEMIERPRGLVGYGLVSIYALFYKLGFSASAAFALHMASGVVIAGAALLAVWRCRDTGQEDGAQVIAILVFASLLLTPYLLFYDLAIIAAALFAWLMSGAQDLPRWFYMAIGVFWALPVILIAASIVHIPLMAPLLLLLYAGLVHRALSGKTAGVSRVFAVPA